MFTTKLRKMFCMMKLLRRKTIQLVGLTILHIALTCIIRSLFKWLRYRQLRFDTLHPGSTVHSCPVKFSSWLTTANRKPVGSRPIAKQNRITCITGRAKINSMTLQAKHTSPWVPIVAWLDKEVQFYCRH